MKRMTYEEIKKAYPDEWVLIDELEQNETLDILSGIIVTHSPKRAEVDAVSVQRTGDLALFYTGKIKGTFALSLL